MDSSLRFTFLKPFVIGVLCAASLVGTVRAGVDVNSADEVTLHTINGIGPAKAKAIIEERDARGPFKDPGELAQRVKGLGAKSIDKWQRGGLTFVSAAFAPGGAASGAKTSASAGETRCSGAVHGTAGTYGTATTAGTYGTACKRGTEATAGMYGTAGTYGTAGATGGTNIVRK